MQQIDEKTPGQRKWQKKTARLIQELTGRSYQSACNVLHQWQREGRDVDAELLRLAKEDRSIQQIGARIVAAASRAMPEKEAK